MLKIFKGCNSDKLTNCESFFKHSLNLPSSPVLSFKSSFNENNCTFRY